mmetsp:Transcript_25424/g.36187  ORF Transcript_25424/g.36187 Transcript_25424/m.36187 type:complete len:119 (+) Transcript_25424:165-521(+)
MSRRGVVGCCDSWCTGGTSFIHVAFGGPEGSGGTLGQRGVDRTRILSAHIGVSGARSDTVREEVIGSSSGSGSGSSSGDTVRVFLMNCRTVVKAMLSSSWNSRGTGEREEEKKTGDTA